MSNITLESLTIGEKKYFYFRKHDNEVSYFRGTRKRHSNCRVSSSVWRMIVLDILRHSVCSVTSWINNLLTLETSDYATSPDAIVLLIVEGYSLVAAKYNKGTRFRSRDFYFWTQVAYDLLMTGVSSANCFFCDCNPFWEYCRKNSKFFLYISLHSSNEVLFTLIADRA